MNQQRLKDLSTLGLLLFGAVALLSIAAQNVLFLGLAPWVWLAWKGQGGKLRLGPWAWAYLAFLLWALAASLLSDNAGHSLETWRKWLLAVALVYAGAWLGGRPRDLRSVAIACLAFSGLWALGASLWSLRLPWAALAQGQSLGAVLQAWGGGDWRAVSGSGGYMVLGTGSMLLAVLFCGAALRDDGFKRPWALAALGSLALALLLTLTRSAWLGAGAGVLLVLGLDGRWKLLLGLGLAALLLVLLPGSPVAQRLRQGADLQHISTRERIYMAEAGKAIIAEHPWWGVGDAMESFGGHDGYYFRYRSQAAREDRELKDSDQGHLHDDGIMVAALYGLPALALLLLAHALLAARLWRGSRARGLAGGLALGALGSLLAWWVNGLFEYNFGSFQSSFTLWFLLGLGLAGAEAAMVPPAGEP